MGDVKKVLAVDKLEPRSITPREVWADLCENIHLHIRNIRYDMDPDEWARIRGAVNHLGAAVEWAMGKYQYEGGDPTFLVHLGYNFPFSSPSSQFYPNRALIELQRDGTFHFHYRDLRIHIPLSEFRTVSKLFRVAEAELEKVEAGHYEPPLWVREAKEITTGTVPIECIQPYDDGHRADAIDFEHNLGIKYAKFLLQQGKKLRPIYIAPTGQRLDGFKRYMAALELGHKEIEVIVDPFWTKDGISHSGQQHGEPMLDDSELGDA